MATANVVVTITVRAPGLSRDLTKLIEESIAATAEQAAKRELRRQLDNLSAENGERS